MEISVVMFINLLSIIMKHVLDTQKYHTKHKISSTIQNAFERHVG